MAYGKLPEGIIWRTINGARVAINPKTGTAVAGAGGRLTGVVLNWYDDMGAMPSRLVPQTPAIGPDGQRGLAFGPGTIGSGVGGELRGRKARADYRAAEEMKALRGEIDDMLKGNDGGAGGDHSDSIRQYVQYLQGERDGRDTPRNVQWGAGSGQPGYSKSKSKSRDPWDDEDLDARPDAAEAKRQLTHLRDFLSGEVDTLDPKIGRQISRFNRLQSDRIDDDGQLQITKYDIGGKTREELGMAPWKGDNWAGYRPSIKAQENQPPKAPTTPGRPSTRAELKAARDRAEAAIAATASKVVSREKIYPEGGMAGRVLAKMSDGTYKLTKDGPSYPTRKAAIEAANKLGRDAAAAESASRDRAARDRVARSIDAGNEQAFRNPADIKAAKEIAAARGLKVSEGKDSVIVTKPKAPPVAPDLSKAKATAREIAKMTAGATDATQVELHKLARRIANGKGNYRDLDRLKALQQEIAAVAPKAPTSADAWKYGKDGQQAKPAPVRPGASDAEWARYDALGAPKETASWSGSYSGFKKREVGLGDAEGKPTRANAYIRDDFAVVSVGKGRHGQGMFDVVHIPTGLRVNNGVSRNHGMKIVREATDILRSADVRVRTPNVEDTVTTLKTTGAVNPLRRST